MSAPGLELLLDADRLAALVGVQVRATRLRPKPGVSTVAALVTADGRPRGWVRALEGDARAKAAKAREHASLLGRQDEVGEAELAETGTLVQWGPVGTDPRLALRAARARLGSDLTVLRHNPLRRLVVRDGQAVHRITAQPHRQRLTSLARALARAGVPVVAPVGVPGVHGSRISTWPWVEGRDATGTTDPRVLAEIGASLARLHAATPDLFAGATDRPGAREILLPGRAWDDMVAAATASVDQLSLVGLPAAEARARSVLERLRAATPSAGAPVVSHGDFSADQCLVPDGGGVLLTDLDRAALAPPELDLASFLATSLLDGSDGSTFLAGYAGAPRPASAPAVPAAWVAACLLARVAEPWRMQRRDWADETGRLVDLAGSLLDAPGVPTGTTGPTVRALPEGGTSVPEIVTDAGDRVVVDRAWPGKVRDGIPRITVEGRDRAGRLRAGTWDATGRTRLLPPGADHALPALESTAATGELVVHRAGRRAVVRGEAAYAKVVRPGRGPALAVASETGRRLAEQAGIDAPRVLAAGDDVVELSVVAGRPLHDLADSPGWNAAWDRWAQAWTRLQALPGPADLSVHGDADEARVLRTWADKAADLLGGTPWPARTEQVAAALETRADVGSHRLVPSHRDLHDKQLLWDGARLSVLDLDTACLADPALDPANLAAHASLRGAQGLWSLGAVEAVRTRARAVAAAAGVDEEGWRLAERATVARLAAVYAFRPRWRRTVLHWAEAAWTTLADEKVLTDVSSRSPEPAAGWGV